MSAASPETPSPVRVAQAIGIILAGIFLLDMMGVFIRMLSATYPASELAAFRNSFGLLPGVLVLLFPERAMRQLRGHSWPGNLREFAMVAENAVLFALAEMSAVRGGDRVDVIQVRPKLIRDLLHALPSSEQPSGEEDGGDGWRVSVQVSAQDSLNKVSVDCERQYFTQLYFREKGDFSRMAEVLLGTADHARKVQLRFNQLGLKVRELKSRLPS